MRYDVTDYVKKTKEEVVALIKREFDGAAVYLFDPGHIPAFGDGGTFCLEAASSAVETAAADYGRVVVTLRVWTYVERADGAAEEAVTALAQKLEAVLFAAAEPSFRVYPAWLATEYLQTNYMTAEKGRAFRRKPLRAARTEWRVRLAARR
ncbi:MAG: hypothetical protein GTN49_07030 [candidate division Zixibacteria bacterium]|nr:hypothetical protein [candidate division Zixibacteria bacterium]